MYFSCSFSVSLKLFQIVKYFKNETISFHLLLPSPCLLHVPEIFRLFSTSLAIPEEREMIDLRPIPALSVHLCITRNYIFQAPSRSASWWVRLLQAMTEAWGAEEGRSRLFVSLSALGSISVSDSIFKPPAPPKFQFPLGGPGSWALVAPFLTCSSSPEWVSVFLLLLIYRLSRYPLFGSSALSSPVVWFQNISTNSLTLLRTSPLLDWEAELA